MTRFKLLIQTTCLAAAFGSPFAAQAEVNYSQTLKGSELPIGTLLEWATSFESDMEMFVLEKSTDGIKFEDLGTIQASGFSVVDKNPFSPSFIISLFTPTGDIIVGMDSAMYCKPFKPHLPFAQASSGNGIMPISISCRSSSSVCLL